MAVATVVKSIGSAGGRAFSSLSAWNSGAPADLTTAERWTAGSFVGTFTQGETVTGTGLTTGKFLDSNGSTYVTFGISAGNTATLIILTGTTSGATCVVSAKTHTGIIWQGQCYNDSEFVSSSNLLTVAGSTVSATCYKELTTAAGQSFSDNVNVQTNALCYNASNGVGIRLTSYYNTAISVSESYFHMSKLQVAATGSTGSSPASLGANNVVDACILEGVGTSGGATVTALGGTISNTLIENRKASATGAILLNATNALSLVNCTLASPSDKTAVTNGIKASYGNVAIKNCAIFGVSNVTFTGAGAAYTTTTSYCDNIGTGSATGWTALAYNTTTGSGFQNITDATRDYRIKSSSGLIDVGTSYSAPPPTADIAGTARPSGSGWDVGAWEYAAGLSPVTGTAADVQAPNVSTAAGTVQVSGTAADAQGKNVSTASGTVAVSGTAADAQASNVSTAAGTVSVSGSAVDVQGKNVSTGTATVTITGTAADTQAANVSNGAGVVGNVVTGTAADVQAPNVSTGAGSIGAVTGSATDAQAPNVSTASGTVAVSGSAADTQAPNVSTAVGSLAITGGAADVQGKNVSTGAGAVAITGSAADTQAPNISTGIAQVISGIVGVGASVQNPNISNGVGTVRAAYSPGFLCVDVVALVTLSVMIQAKATLETEVTRHECLCD